MANRPAPFRQVELTRALKAAKAADVSVRIEIEGGKLTLEDAWRHGASRDNGSRWKAEELGEVVDALIAEGADPEPVYGT